MVTRGHTATEQSDREFWGAPAEWGGTSGDREFALYPENLEPVLFFLDIQTQWNVSAAGERLGLNYPGVESAARLLDFELNSENFRKLQLMERTIIKETRQNA